MKQKKWPIVISLLVLAWAVVLSACGTKTPTPTKTPIPTPEPKTTSASPATGTATQAPKKTGGTLVWLGHQEVAGLSPNDAAPYVQWVMIANIHNALLEVNSKLELEPVLAESYEVSEDGLTYTFKLRKGVKFHDGTEFTAKDVKYTFDYYRDPKNAATIANNFLGLDSVETPDDYTVICRMKEPNASFLGNGATTFIVPAAYHSQVGEEKYRTAPIGTGPFKLKEWRPSEYTLLEAFDDHFRGRPKIDFLRENIVPEPSVRAIALQTGAAHSSVWPLLAEDNLKFAADPNFKVYRVPSPGPNFFPLNNSLPQFSDKRVRQAMLYAIDRQQVIDDVFKGTASVAHTYVSPLYEFWYNPDVKKYDYDPEKAKALLDEAGWKVGADGIREKDGVKLRFTCYVITGDQARRPEAEVVQQYWRNVGIDMQIAEAPVASILQGMRKGTMEAALYNWAHMSASGDPDVSVMFRSNGGNNFFQWKNPRVDELLDRGLREVNPEKRRAIYFELQEVFAEEVPYIYMMVWDVFYIWSNKVQGLPDTCSGLELYREAYKFTLAE